MSVPNWSKMSIAQTVTDVLREHVTLEVESIDRMYLNVYVPQLQHERGVVAFSGSIAGNMRRRR